MRPSKHWLITDTHFNHQMLVTQGHRPADFQARILSNWRRLVASQDFVWHLGDVILGQNGTLGDILNSLPGTKFLVRGNHDHESDGWYMRHGFQFCAQGVLRGGVWLSHAPALSLPSGAILNVHGHLHNNTHHTEHVTRPEHCKLLALEATDYAPVEFDEFVGFSPVLRSLL